VRTPDTSSLTLQNTLRRILEHYFKILGGVDFNDICEQFEGNDKLVCNALFSWVHGGSHGFLDDVHISSDSITIEAYLKVFEDIFRKLKHGAHYNMMMKKECIVLNILPLEEKIKASESNQQSAAA
jgi:wobble nucleotide-excising tRNase